MSTNQTETPKRWTNTGHAVACTERACVEHCPRRRDPPKATQPQPNGQEKPE